MNFTAPDIYCGGKARLVQNRFQTNDLNLTWLAKAALLLQFFFVFNDLPLQL